MSPSLTAEELPRLAASVDEAREQARLLHETFGETLRVVHRDFFTRKEKLPFPSQSLSEVFDGLAASRKIQLRWIASEETAMNLSHLPADDFERQALGALGRGEREHQVVDGDRLRYAGPIPMENKCLKCHLQNRTSLDTRVAGLAISVPFRSP